MVAWGSGCWNATLYRQWYNWAGALGLFLTTFTFPSSAPGPNPCWVSWERFWWIPRKSCQKLVTFSVSGEGSLHWTTAPPRLKFNSLFLHKGDQAVSCVCHPAENFKRKGISKILHRITEILVIIPRHPTRHWNSLSSCWPLPFLHATWWNLMFRQFAQYLLDLCYRRKSQSAIRPWIIVRQLVRIVFTV